MDWFDDEDFWRDFYPAMFTAERFAAAAGDVEQILALTRFNGQAVLDLCCGPGRHAVEFAQRGLAVTGVDRTPFLLDLARKRGVESGVAVEWVMEDMRRFRRPAAFDLVCNLFTSFGYFDQEDDDLLVLRNIHESLKDGGVFVIEVIGKEYLARVWKSPRSTDLPDGTLLVQQAQIRSDWTRVYNEWMLLKDGAYRKFALEHTIYSGRELKDRILASGFTQVDLYGDLQGRPYGLEASRLVAVARNNPG